MLKGKIIETSVNHIVVEYVDDFGRKKHITVGNKYLRFRPFVGDIVTIYKANNGYKVEKTTVNNFTNKKSINLFLTFIFCFGLIFITISNLDKVNFGHTIPSKDTVVEKQAYQNIESSKKPIKQTTPNNTTNDSEKSYEQEGKKENKVKESRESPNYVQDTGVDIDNEYYDFANCTEVRKVYPHGISKNHASFKDKFDRDKYGWGCEK